MLFPRKTFNLDLVEEFLKTWNVNFSPFFDRDSTKNKILWGSARVFSQQGLNLTTVQDILKNANISRRTFYQAFKNKEDVLAELFDISATILLQMVKDAVSEKRTITEKLEAGINSFFDLLLTTGPLGNFLLSESMRPESPLCKKRVALYAKIVEFMQENVIEEQHRSLDPIVLQIFIFAVVGAALHLYQETGMTEKEVERAKTALVAITARAAALSIEEVPPLPELEKK
ncbi:TetR/AcrR family transcriptional regulator [Deltaproteobacteria bacterium TL4]